jgi:hypothetical protein
MVYRSAERGHHQRKPQSRKQTTPRYNLPNFRNGSKEEVQRMQSLVDSSEESEVGEAPSIFNVIDKLCEIHKGDEFVPLNEFRRLNESSTTTSTSVLCVCSAERFTLHKWRNPTTRYGPRGGAYGNLTYDQFLGDLQLSPENPPSEEKQFMAFRCSRWIHLTGISMPL